MITAEQEARLSQSSDRAKRKQDRTNPMVINIDDGRLMPNTPRLRKHAKYRVYGGDVRAPLEKRMKWLEGAMRQSPTKIINSMEIADEFDVGKADADELVVFANEQFGLILDPTEPLPVLRKRVMAKANEVPGDSLA